ncbi:hypothetical protein BJX65DRAFT_305253 [Aspergillus insuetus]
MDASRSTRALVPSSENTMFTPLSQTQRRRVLGTHVRRPLKAPRRPSPSRGRRCPRGYKSPSRNQITPWASRLLHSPVPSSTNSLHSSVPRGAPPSFFKATTNLYFPFMVSEARSESVPLLVAQRAIANSMAVCLRGIIALFKIARREKELHRQVLGFSIAHTAKAVVISAHYPVLTDDRGVTFHFHEITRFVLGAARGRDRWTSYKFTLVVYEHLSLVLLEKIHSAIDNIPDDLDT